MIIDTLQNASKYYSVHPLFAGAFEYITNTNWTKTEPGKFEVNGSDLKAILTDNPGKTKEVSIAKFECHNKYIDIQVCLHGNELIGWKPREKCISENGGYNEEKDLQLYSDEPDMYFQLTDGQFAIFFPGDVHAPMIGEGNIKKLVIKVKL